MRYTVACNKHTVPCETLDTGAWQRPFHMGVTSGTRQDVAVDVDIHVDIDGDVAAGLCETMP